MQAPIALAVALIFIVFLFVRDFRRNPELSHALWVPLIWIFLAGSRDISAWLSLGSSQIQTIEAYSEGNSLNRFVLLTLIALAVVILTRRKLSLRTLIKDNKFIFAFLVYCLLSTLWSDSPYSAIKRFIKFIGIFPVILLILTEKKPVDAIRAVLRRSIYLLVPLSFLFVRYFPDYGRYYLEWSGQVFYSGVANNKNELGLICILSIVFVLWESTQLTKLGPGILKSAETWISIVMIVISAYLAHIAKSATSITCIVAGCLIVLLSGLPGSRKLPERIGVKFAASAALAAALQLVFNIKDVVIRALGRDPTITGRTGLWSLLLSFQINPILGSGYESFWTSTRMAQIWSTMGIPALQAHNGYLDTYLSLGVIGLFFLAGLILGAGKKVSGEFLASYAKSQLALAFVIIFALFNYTETAFPRPGLLLIIFLLFSLRVPHGEFPDQEPDHLPDDRTAVCDNLARI